MGLEILGLIAIPYSITIAIAGMIWGWTPHTIYITSVVDLASVYGIWAIGCLILRHWVWAAVLTEISCAVATSPWWWNPLGLS